MSSNYLQEIEPYFKNLSISVSYEIVPKVLEWSQNSWSSNTKSIRLRQNSFEVKINSNIQALTLFRSSIQDSINRGLDQNINWVKVFTDETYFDEIIKKRYEYGYDLGEYYTYLNEKYSPDMIAISHGNYDYYVILYLSAHYSKSKTLVINGGWLNSYILESDKSLIHR